MSNNNNLEEFFRNSFEDFDGKPSNEVWNSIAKDREMKHDLGLTEQTPESVFSRAFGSFNSNPSGKVWLGIREYLLKKIFYRRLKYTLIALLFIGFSSAVYVFTGSKIETSDSKNGSQNLSSLADNTINTSESSNLPSNKPAELIPTINKNSGFETQGIGSNTLSNHPVSEVQLSNGLNHNIQTNPNKRRNTNFLVNRNTIQSNIEEKESMLAKQESQGEMVKEAIEEEKNENKEVVKTEENKPVETKNVEVKTKPKTTKKTNNLKDNSKVNNFVKYTKETDINNEESGIKIGIMAGLDYGNFTLKGGSELYKDVRKNQELFRASSYHTGITFSKMLNSNWYIQANAVFANQAMNVAYDKKKVVSDTTRDAFGNIIKIENKTIFSVDTTTHYAFSTLEIPFLLGYRIGEKRWTFHALLGPSWNLIVSKRGEMLSANTMQVASVTDNQLIPTVKHVWGIWAAVGASYQVNHHYSLTIEPMFRYKINSLFNANYAAKQYNYATGINLGIRYHLF